jgi:hypothetical protein
VKRARHIGQRCSPARSTSNMLKHVGQRNVSTPGHLFRETPQFQPAARPDLAAQVWQTAQFPVKPRIKWAVPG